MLDERGWEVPDSQPRQIKSSLVSPPTLQETIMRVLRQQQAQRILASEGIEETPEEAEDFDIDDITFDPTTKYEFAADAVPHARVKQALLDAVKEKPGIRSYVERLYAHIFPAGIPEPAAAPPKEDPPK